MSQRIRLLLVPLVLLVFCAALPGARADVIYYAETTYDMPAQGRIVRDLGTGNIKQVVASHAFPIDSIALDTTAGKLYWTAYDQAIRRANLDGSGAEVIVPAPDGLGHDIEVDAAGGKIYWRGGGLIRRANLNGSEVEVLLDPPLSDTGGIAVHAPTNKLYWANNNSPHDDDLHHQIRRANRDGSGEELVMERDDWLRLVNIEIDTDNPSSRMYWVQWVPYSGGMAAADLDGSNYETFDLEVDFESSLLTLTSSRVYWTLSPCGEPGCLPGYVYRANLDGSSQNQLFQADGYIHAIAVDEHSDSIPVPASSPVAVLLLAVLLLAGSSAFLLRR